MTLKPIAYSLIGACLISACATGRADAPDLQLVYNAAAQYHLPDRNPVIVIPGILGSRLVDRPTGDLVWGAFTAEAADPQKPAGARLVALPITGAERLRDLRDEVAPVGVLDRVRLRIGFLPIELRAYAQILSTLGAGGYRDEQLGLSGVDYGPGHFTCFQFAYDWRRDNAENAQLLGEFIRARQIYVAERYRSDYGLEIDPRTIKFDLVAHSMGGLIARYFLMYGEQSLDDGAPELTWAGAEMVERAILVGAPNHGSSVALQQLVDGADVGKPILPFYPPALLGTFPSVYQLLPRGRHLPAVWDGDLGRPIEDLYDPKVWRAAGWGLADAAQEKVLADLLPEVEDAAERRRLALGFQEKALARARDFAAALDRPAPAPAGLDLFIVVGDAQSTPQTLSVEAKTGKLSVFSTAPGDGTVLRSSALADERPAGAWRPTLASPIDWDRTLMLFSDHFGLTKDPAFADNVLYWLLEDPRRRGPSGPLAPEGSDAANG